MSAAPSEVDWSKGWPFGMKASVQPPRNTPWLAMVCCQATGMPEASTPPRTRDITKGRYDMPRTSSSRVRGGVDASGMPVAWQQTIASQGVLRGGWTDAFIPKGQPFDQSSSEGAADMIYDVPN